MDDPLDLTVLKALTTHLQGITPTNGYDFNLSTSVFRGRSFYGADDPIPMLSILESPNPSFGIYAGQNDEARKYDWTLYVQGFVADNKANPTDPAYLLKAVVEHRLARIIATNEKGFGGPKYPTEYMLGGLIDGLTMLPGVVRPPTEGVSSKAFFYLPVRIKLT